MLTQLSTRRGFSVRLASLVPLLGTAGTALASAAMAAGTAPNGEISHTAESIHQEPIFKAGRKRVYEALMDEKQFGKMTGGLPAEISREVGGAFSLFGAQIKGRQVELHPDQLIIQAWRSEGWRPGIYSIARFELVEQGGGTRIVFDHTGFPIGQAAHLVAGWNEHYWEPLTKYLV